MLQRVLCFFLSSLLASAATFHVSAGKYTAGVYQSVLTSDVTVTLTGTVTSGHAEKFSIGFPLSNSNVVQIYLPTGISGSCTGGSCNFITRDANTGGGCDSSNSAQWPLNNQGRPSIKMVGCGDIQADGTITYLVNADPGFDLQSYAYVEGSQIIQGSLGPCPCTFENNDLYLTGNAFHMANDGGANAVKTDYYIKRNRFRPYWGGMVGSVDADGNDYGTRHQAMEWKGGSRITIEGNQFLGNYNDRSQASVGLILVFRNENQGIDNVLVKDNFFQHIAGGILFNDANFGNMNPTGPFGPTGYNAALVNNIFADINEKGPSNGCSHRYGCLPTGTGSYASEGGNVTQFGAIDSGQGWVLEGPTLASRLTIMGNTIPNPKGSIPVLQFASNQKAGGLVMKNNFLGINNSPYVYGYGYRGGDAGSPCKDGSGNDLQGHAGMVCGWPGAIISGNVLTSDSFTAQSISNDGWTSGGNTVLGNNVPFTTIWPKYNIQDWHTNLDPEMFRLPSGSPYAGKGADITQMKRTMGWVEGATAWFTKDNALILSWIDHDDEGKSCSVDIAAPGQLYSTFTRFNLDTGNTTQRSVTIPASNFAPHTTVAWRINCETSQPSGLVKSN